MCAAKKCVAIFFFKDDNYTEGAVNARNIQWVFSWCKVDPKDNEQVQTSKCVTLISHS